jgi:4-oxalocrotonate tautomerase family enzyme
MLEEILPVLRARPSNDGRQDKYSYPAFFVMPIILMYMHKRTPEVKARIAEKVTQIISEEGKTPPSTVEIFFLDVESGNYSIGGKITRPSTPDMVT